MPSPAEVQVWSEQMVKAGVPADLVAQFVGGVEKAGEGAINELKGSVMATGDYKRKMDALRAQEQDAQKLAAANAALQQELVRWKTAEVDPTLAKAHKIVADQAGIKARIEERAKQLRDKYGMEDADVTALLETTATIQSTVPAEAAAAGVTVADDGKFVKREDFNKVVFSMPDVQATLVDLGVQFNELFAGTGKKFSSRKVLELAKQEGLNLETAFSKLYDVPSRQSELTEAGVQKRIADEVSKVTAVLEAKYAASPGYVRPNEEPSLISTLIERHSKANRDAEGKMKPAEPANPIDQVRRAARGLAPEDDVQKYVSLSRSGKWRERAAKEAAEIGTQ